MLSQLDASGSFKLVQSDLFECEAHLEEICDIMCVATAGTLIHVHVWNRNTSTCVEQEYSYLCCSYRSLHVRERSSFNAVYVYVAMV